MKMGVHFVVQMMLFYIVPLFMKSLGPIGVVFVILSGTFINAVLLGILSKNVTRWFFPAVIAVLFIPSVFIYYNASALVHTLWYFVISLIGLSFGAGLRRVMHCIKRKGE